MFKDSILKHDAIVFIIPALLIGSLVILLNSSSVLANHPNLYRYITIDFIISIPLIYVLLIRKRNISNLTVAPVLILCIIIGSYTIPAENQSLLNIAKTWLIPIIEIGVLTVVVLKVRKAIKLYKKSADTDSDFYDVLINTCHSLFPKTAAKLVTNEVALIYYGFFNFKKLTLKPNEFSNYKGSGILSTLGAIIFVIAVEMIGIHLLAAKWSSTLAWILTGLSFYSALQIIGIIRSVPKRPIVIHEKYLELRFGILSQTKIPFDAIDYVEIVSPSTYEKRKTKESKNLSLLGELEHSNVCIHVKTPQQLEFIYGKPKSFKQLFLFVDHHERFKSEVEMNLSK